MRKLIIHSPKFRKHTVLYDKEDHDEISKRTWHVNYHGKCVYAVHTWIEKGRSRSIKMHQLVTGKKFLDHIDRNGLNNQKKNLRKTSNKTNQYNVPRNCRNVSGFKGVSLYTVGSNKGQFVVSLKVNGKRIHGGYFKNPIDAAKQYNKLVVQYHGEFAYLNPIPK